ncbi:MAG: DNA-directed RNA polymerase subunit beta [Desulfobacterales bacterium]|nr:DNA-directed RNA polymerase subunit beta [Desulfobacterales bacterium]
MSVALMTQQRVRLNFGSKKKIAEIPDLISIQRESYNRFLQMDIPPEKRKDFGLEAVFKSVFPIKDYNGIASLEYVSYSFGEVKHSEEECLHRGMTYEIPVRIRVRLLVYDVDRETKVSNIRDIKEQDIYFGTIPLMTQRGTFIVNGTERVVVSQLHRSSGVFFDHDKGKTHSSGKIVYTSRIIPVRGSWIDLEIDPKDIVYIRIDRKRKFPVTLLFKAFGYTTEDILNYFYKKDKIIIQNNEYYKILNEDNIKGQRASCDIKNPQTGEILVKKGKIFTRRNIKQFIEFKLDFIPISIEELTDKGFGASVIDPKTQNIVAKAGDVIQEETLNQFQELGISQFELLIVDATSGYSSDSIRKTLLLDKVETKEEALIEIYRRLKPGTPPTVEAGQEYIDLLFFRSASYDLSDVGRLKLNHRLGIKTSLDVKTLRKEDILLTTKTLVELRDTQGQVDDIDHLGNRRVRAVGELLESQYRIGLVRMERGIKERMSMQEVDALMPNDLVNPKPVSAVVKEFFGTSQLSQFMDQTNPLSETTHKRRLSALGPGGLTRERAGFEVRDVHPSHYGRICPIETPEGPNIGLIVSLCTYARVNEYGFIETPYRSVMAGKVTNEIKLLSAFEEKDHPIAQANAPLNENNEFINPLVTARKSGEFQMVRKEEIELMDISPNQLVSVSASLIPFLENDDANRALMGSNMQRQAVPLIKCQSPMIGTGIEGVVARDSGVTQVAERDGIVVDVDASRIVIRHDNSSDSSLENATQLPATIFKLQKFVRSNQNTCFNHRPIVKKGQRVKKGEVIADGPATENGELALGKNVTVAFMPWGGYNFEDSILVSEKLVCDGTFTSIHIEEFEVVARDTKLGKEEITRDIPNVGEDALQDLDDSGIIRLGAEVAPGDVLVGKVTPKGETQLSPEEKLLRAIFGEKAGDVKDTSLRVPPGIEGIVIDVKVFSRRGVEKDDRTRIIEDKEIETIEKNKVDLEHIIEDTARKTVEKFLIGKECSAPLKKAKRVLLSANTVITKDMLDVIPLSDFEHIVLKDPNVSESVEFVLDVYRKQMDQCRLYFESHVSKFEKGDDLAPGVNKLIKVYVAMKRILSVGDKMAGRHGNKGVVSRILPIEDLPYFSDGTPVDMVLNPLGVPSRMNVGQILEIHLGRASRMLGQQIDEMLKECRYQELRSKLDNIFNRHSLNKFNFHEMTDDEVINYSLYHKDGLRMATPVFDGANEKNIKELLKEANVSETGQSVLIDGRTGEPFEGKITVGTLYMMKLHHLVDDKIHARSIGPYSLVTQQPLGGKAQFGGQRLGEMEVWAMEAYGSAYALQEFITVKSDDMAGRTRMYEKIVKGQNVLEPGLPESFKVLIKELQSLGLDIKLLEDKEEINHSYE